MPKIDYLRHNRQAWDRYVEQGIEWSIPVSAAEIAAARKGRFAIYLTESKPVPRDWFPADLHGLDLLCLAGSGGQQGPLLAAAGATVTVFDNSPRQLAQDQLVAEREGLSIRTVQGDMADLSVFADASFDLIVHPVSNVFVPEVRPVWREAFRVLRPGGALLSGFMNPAEYIFDLHLLETTSEFKVRFSLPYSDLDDLTAEERLATLGPDAALEWAHTLDDQIEGQLAAGFVLTGFYESYRANKEENPVAHYMPSYIATRAEKTQ
jgi:SAM-dependent methyltransferase